MVSQSCRTGRQGVKQDYQEALTWFRKAADAGSIEAKYLLDIPQDSKNLVDWLRKDVEQGKAIAQSVLGERLARGEGVPQEDVQAYMWLTLASKEGKDYRDFIANRMTPDQIKQAEELAKNWKPVNP